MPEVWSVTFKRDPAAGWPFRIDLSALHKDASLPDAIFPKLAEIRVVGGEMGFLLHPLQTLITSLPRKDLITRVALPSRAEFEVQEQMVWDSIQMATTVDEDNLSPYLAEVYPGGPCLAKLSGETPGLSEDEFEW